MYAIVQWLANLNIKRNVCKQETSLYNGRYTRGSLLPQHAPGAKLPRLHQGNDFELKNMLRNKTFAPEFCSLISNWFDMREQDQGANLLHDSVSGASSLVCTAICFAGACFRSKLPRVYWLGYLRGSVFRECVSAGASSFVCTSSLVPAFNKKIKLPHVRLQQIRGSLRKSGRQRQRR